MWKNTYEYMYLEPNEFISNKLICFDLDGTLIVKANGKHSEHKETNSDNYVFLYGVESTLIQAMNEGYQPVIISNQKNFDNIKMEQMYKIWLQFNQRILILVANQNNKYRKPEQGFINLLKQDGDIQFYCGDAVGNSLFPPYQWSSVDLEFAIRSNIPFYEPIQVFGSNFETEQPKEQLIIMMGNQGSGKTTVARRLETMNYIRYSQDEQLSLTTQKKRKEIADLIRQGYGIIIDATHPSHEKRYHWITLAYELNISWKIWWFVRDGRPFNKLRTKPIPDIAYNIYSKNFERPIDGYIVIS